MTWDRSLFRAIGPGLLWAGTAVGVSHLVQSTRAGAGWSMALVGVVVLANLFKYPAYETGPRYAAATGTSLLEGYRRRGTWTLWLFLALTVSTMFTVIAAVTFVAAGMASALISDSIPIWGWSAVLLTTTVGLLGVGRFAVLERFMTAMMLLLTISTLASVAILLPSTDWSAIQWTFGDAELPALAFVVGLVGWMPSALDTAVWHSLWSLEKSGTEGRALTVRGARLDFNIGYVGTAILAVLFVFLGARVLFGTVEEIPTSGVGFATMLVGAYATALGEWSRPFILVAAFSTMLSTTVAVTDGFPRAVEGAVAGLRQQVRVPGIRTRAYWIALGVCVVVAQAICVVFLGQLTRLVDLATGLTGVTAPLLAMLNLWTIRGAEVPREHRPGAAFTAFHLVGIAALWAMALLYLYARFG